MTVPSHFHLPGAFQSEGVHPGLFRPPMSPSASSSLSCAASRSTSSHDVHATRKRQRNEISRSQEDYRDNEMDSDGFFATPVAQMRSDDRRYYLAGQLDTPNGGPFESGILGESMYSDSDYRRILGSKRPREEMESSMSGPTPLFNLPAQPAPSKGWGSLAFNTLGGVVGRVWQFCKQGAFRGFYAGGGSGYQMPPVGSEQMSMFEEKTLENHQIPGRFPLIESYPSTRADAEPEEEPVDSRATTPTGPASKRRHTDRPDDLGRNWVMVGDSATADTRTPQRRPPFRPSPRSRNQTPSAGTRKPSLGRRISVPTSRLSSATPASNPRRPPSRLSLATSPARPPPRPSTASTASFAAPRSPSPSKIPQPAPSRRRSTVTHSPTPSFSHRRTQSSVSSASARVGKDASPRLDPEAKRLAARRSKDEREADVRMSALNKQLQDMIRQGKEALGTTFEVEGNWDDEDY